VYGVASDDNHYSQSGVARGWIMVKSPALTKEDIEENIRKGNFYASTGVILNDYQVTKSYISVDSQNGNSISFIGKNGSVLLTVIGKNANYKIKGNELYVRVKITNNAGKAAWTQPVFVN
jgi:DNA replication protein DnaC